MGIRAGATSLSVLRAARVPVVQGVLNKALAPVYLVALIAHRYAAALRPRRADDHGPAWVARLATVALAGLALADLVGFDIGRLALFVWPALAALLLTLAFVAPLTTVIAAFLVCGIGLASVAPESWRPEGWPHWLVPLHPVVAFIALVGVLTVISLPKVDGVDRFLRGVSRRGDETVEPLADVTG